MTSDTSVAISLKHREMVILGTEYAGEMKKGVFRWGRAALAAVAAGWSERFGAARCAVCTQPSKPDKHPPLLHALPDA
jgi:hypothetical protein